jgi:NAD(P)-dependent dehydrogenase (short-subunit alcohol dehydrogenase family)
MQPSFDIQNKIAVVTGGAGVLCSAMCRALAGAGAKVVVLDLSLEKAEALAKELGDNAIGLNCDVLDKSSVEAAAQTVMHLRPVRFKRNVHPFGFCEPAQFILSQPVDQKAV